MRLIHKHPVIVGDAGQIVATEGAEFVHFAAQGQQLCAWVEFDPSQPVANIGYRVFATGQPVEPPVGIEAEHRFSCLMMDGTYVWHLYRVWHTDGR